MAIVSETDSNNGTIIGYFSKQMEFAIDKHILLHFGIVLFIISFYPTVK